jgi:hypothetical protein
VRARPLLLIPVCLVLLAACGERDSDPTACALLERVQVEGALRAAGAEVPSLRQRSSEALDQSMCIYRGRGVTVRLNIDSAPEARRRYFNRVTEALQFSVHDPGARPQPLKGLGDEDASGPSGAYWVRDTRQLFVLRGERLFIYQASVQGLGARQDRAATVRLAARTLPGERRRVRAQEQAAAGPLVLELHAPEDGDVVRSGRVVVRGAVGGRSPAVTVNGRRVPVREGAFAGTIALHAGRNRIRVAAASAGRTLRKTVDVRRGRSTFALGQAFARRHPGEVPDLLARPLPEARALLRGAGIRHRVVPLASGSLRRGDWAVCRTKPAPGARVRGALVLFADRADPFRTSETACAQE